MYDLSVSHSVEPAALQSAIGLTAAQLGARYLRLQTAKGTVAGAMTHGCRRRYIRLQARSPTTSLRGQRPSHPRRRFMSEQSKKCHNEMIL